MSMPTDAAAIDLMLTIPEENFARHYEFMKPMLRDESQKSFEMPAQYMLKEIPQAGRHEDYIAYAIEQLDRHNIEKAMIGVR
jgi:hypothetical protein